MFSQLLQQHLTWALGLQLQGKILLVWGDERLQAER